MSTKTIEKVSAVSAGDSVGMTGYGSTLSWVAALPPCEAKGNGRWYCSRHHKGFDNQFQKDIHIHTGKHKMAWVCFEHGVEAP